VLVIYQISRKKRDHHSWTMKMVMLWDNENRHSSLDLSLLVDPVELGRLVRLNLLRLEPECNLLLRALHTVRAVADVAANIDGVVTTDGTRGRGKRVGGAEDAYILVSTA
jgi:hypothetical protein